MTSELQARINREKAAKADDSPARPTPPVDYAKSLPLEYRMDLVLGGLAELGMGPDKLEEIRARRQAERQARETQERVATAKAQDEAEKERLKSNRATFQKIRPYLRVAPRDFETRFKVTEDGFLVATDSGVCDCGYDYKINLVGCIDALMNGESRGLWFRRRHTCTIKKTDGTTDTRTKIEPAIGVYLDETAMSSALVGKTRWSSQPPESFRIERPVL